LVQKGAIAPATFARALRSTPEATRDTWLDLIWDIDDVPDDEEALPRGCVPYMPCPVSAALEGLQRAVVSRDDVLVDVGSGAGRIALLAHLLTGCGSIGLEVQPGLVQAAQGRADWLNLERVRFIRGDATKLIRFVPIGTVFFLYCPFDAAHLREFLAGLEDRARAKQIRVCCVDMPPLKRPWLVRDTSSSRRTEVYRSTLHRMATTS
jgi:SAM-dependent methyltransferase